MSKYKYAKLSTIKKYEPEMRRLGVSTVARSKSGFLSAYKRAGGNQKHLSEYWQRRRDGFIKRHFAQVKKRGESLKRNGKYTRRALALIAWAWMPRGGR